MAYKKLLQFPSPNRMEVAAVLYFRRNGVKLLFDETAKRILEQIISWFDRNENSIAKMIPKFSYEYIVKRLNSKQYRHMKDEFVALFKCEKLEYHGEIMDVYVRVYPNDEQKNTRIFEILDEIGYNKLSLYNYIKHLSDKRGAHIDVGHSLVVELVNYPDSDGMTAIHYFAVQMIYAAKKQIAELNDYWNEMPELICENEKMINCICKNRSM